MWWPRITESKLNDEDIATVNSGDTDTSEHVRYTQSLIARMRSSERYARPRPNIAKWKHDGR